MSHSVDLARLVQSKSSKISGDVAYCSQEQSKPYKHVISSLDPEYPRYLGRPNVMLFYGRSPQCPLTNVAGLDKVVSVRRH